MVKFIIENISSILIGAAVLGLIVLAAVKTVKNKKKNTGCGCGCQGCDICHK